MTNSIFAWTRLMNIIGFLALAVCCFCSEAEAQNRPGTIVDLSDVFGENFQLEDIGRTVDGSLNLIGNGDDVAQLIQIAPDRLSFTSSELIGVRDTTEVFGISSDGSRVAGVSFSSDRSEAEATTWLASNPESGIGLGLEGSSTRLSGGFGAWDQGVVGSNDGVSDAFKWSSTGNDFQILPDAGGISEASDVSSNGSIVVGFSSDFGAIGGATYWDSSGINQLSDPFGRNGDANAISPNAEYIGGELVFFDAATFETGTQGAVWSGDDFANLTLLEELDDFGELTRFSGVINDVSDSGWAVGESLDGSGIIWHETFNGIDSPYLGVQDFNTWLESETGLFLPTSATSVVGISEDSITGYLHFAVNGLASVVSVQVSSPIGDFDGDGDVDCDDLDGYVGNLGATVTAELAPLDLDNDGTLSAADANTLITTLIQTSNGRTGTFPGDLNCDGVVNVLGDAFALVGNLGNSVDSYSQGDINFDGTVDVLGDAFILVGNLGLSNEP